MNILDWIAILVLIIVLIIAGYGGSQIGHTHSRITNSCQHEMTGEIKI